MSINQDDPAPFQDLMRVTVRNSQGKIVRIFDLEIEHDVVFVGGEWKPGVIVTDEGDFEAVEICDEINEMGFEEDRDGIPVGAHGSFEDDDTVWVAERVPKGMPRPALDEGVIPETS